MKIGIRTGVSLVAGVGMLFWWLTLPYGHTVDAAKCEPKGLLASLSAQLYRSRFWSEQLPAIRAEAEKYEQRPAKLREIQQQSAAAAALARAAMEKVYAAHPEMTPSPMARRAQQLRDAADLLENEEATAVMVKHTMKLAADARLCEAVLTKGWDAFPDVTPPPPSTAPK